MQIVHVLCMNQLMEQSLEIMMGAIKMQLLEIMLMKICAVQVARSQPLWYQVGKGFIILETFLLGLNSRSNNGS